MFWKEFVHKFKYEIHTNSDQFLHEKLVMLRMTCTVFRKNEMKFIQNIHGGKLQAT